MCYIRVWGFAFVCSISYQKNKGRKEPLSGCFWFVTEDESYGLIFLFEGAMTGTAENFTPFYQCSRSEAGRGARHHRRDPLDLRRLVPPTLPPPKAPILNTAW